MKENASELNVSSFKKER